MLLIAGGVPAQDRPAVAAAPRPPLPWEVWHDSRWLPHLFPGDQVLLESSHCRDGCAFDRHSPEDPRFLRVDGEEGVVFEQTGAGAITRIWMTMGDGQSVPLDPSIHLRMYLDGETEPRINLPLPDLFSGENPPFVAPFVGDRKVSSGGNFSYVPIPYRQGCRITLAGAANAKLWYQFTYHRLADPAGVATFTGQEDLGGLASFLAAAGNDPWPETEPGAIDEGYVSLFPRQTIELHRAEGAGLLTGLRLLVPPEVWDKVRLVLRFDDRETASLLLHDFFALGLPGAATTRSLFLGRDAAGILYAYYPMPYFQRVSLQLVSLAESGSPPIEVGYWIRRSRHEPLPGSGHFGAQLNVSNEVKGSDHPLLILGGTAGKWVGLFAELGSVGKNNRFYLEGDEQVYVDGAAQPDLYGTGVEDFFNGGFYFDHGSFNLPLHGMVYQQPTSLGEDITAAYRLLLTDAVPWTTGILAGLEPGKDGETPIRARTVAYYYQREESAP